MDKGKLFPRLFENIVRQRLAEFEVVMIEGPRQSGKTTLLKKFADPDRQYLSCEWDYVKQAVDADLHGFLAGLGPSAIIDEVQHKRELVQALKCEADERPGPGRFLVAGASSIRMLRGIGRSLAGLSCSLTLQPLCQAELHMDGDNVFLDYLFGDSTGKFYERMEVCDFDAAAVRGGYPRLQALRSTRQRSAWLRHYCEEVATLDFPQIRQMRVGISLRDLLRSLGLMVTRKLNLQDLSRSLGIDRLTVREHIHTLLDLGLIELLECYDPERDMSSLRRRRKLQFTDSGLLAAVLKLSPEVFMSRSPMATFAGTLFECLIYSEIAKLCNARDDGHELYYWSLDKRAEVDIVIQYDDKIVGVDVKRSRSVRQEDFAGLMKLAGEATNMHRGIVIHTGEYLYNMKELSEASEVPMQAIPANWLWAKPAAEQLDILKQPEPA